MKFWLVMFLLQPNGDFISKQEIQLDDQQMCLIMADITLHNKGSQNIEANCVSDDHHAGRSVDKNVPLD
jgi:hypothetical protein